MTCNSNLESGLLELKVAMAEVEKRINQFNENYANQEYLTKRDKEPQIRTQTNES